MKAKIYIDGRIGKAENEAGEIVGVDTLDLIRQFKSYEDVAEVEVVINSQGGSVKEGDKMYNYLAGLAEKYKYTTVIKKAYSIASKLTLLGEGVIDSDLEKPIMLHYPHVVLDNVKLEAEDAQVIADNLEEIKTEFKSFYSSKLAIDENTVGELLADETYLTKEEAVDLGFAKKIVNKVEVLAEYDIRLNNKDNMKTDKKNLLDKIAAMVGEFVDNFKVDPVAEITLQDSNGTDVVFPNLEEGATPVIGSAAQVDGTAIADGTYIMPSFPNMPNARVTFESGAITSIEEEEIEAVAETEGFEISTWSMRLVNDSFSVGDIAKYYSWEDEEQVAATAEIKLPDGRTIVTDASGVIVSIKEAVEQTIEVTPEAMIEEILPAKLEEVTLKVKEKIEAKHSEVVDGLKNQLTEKEDLIISQAEEIKALKAKITSPQASGSEEENNNSKDENLSYAERIWKSK